MVWRGLGFRVSPALGLGFGGVKAFVLYMRRRAGRRWPAVGVQSVIAVVPWNASLQSLLAW